MPRYSTKFSSKRPIRRYAFFVAIALLVGFLLLQRSSQLDNSIEPVRGLAGDQLFMTAEETVWERIFGSSPKDIRIAQLEARIRELSTYEALALSMTARMEMYEQMLNVQGEVRGTEVTARVVAESNGPFAEALLANAGTANGIAVGFYAENDRGLVGRVVQVGRRSSRVLKITDFNSRVPVMGESSGLRAILFGRRDGKGQLTDQPEAGEFIQGERILTSGEGGLFPRGVVVGIVRPSRDEFLVELAMVSGQLGFVRLKPSQRVLPPETVIPDDDIVSAAGLDEVVADE